MSDANGGTDFVVRPRLGVSDVQRLAPLVAKYSGALMGQEPGAPDEPYVRKLLEEVVVEVAGLELDGELVGFALYYDLPEAISKLRAGQLDDLFVDPSMRGRGGAKILIDHIVEEGRRRNWIHLRWMVPTDSPAAALYDRIAERAPWRNYVIRIDASMKW